MKQLINKTLVILCFVPLSFLHAMEGKFDVSVSTAHEHSLDIAQSDRIKAIAVVEQQENMSNQAKSIVNQQENSALGVANHKSTVIEPSLEDSITIKNDGAAFSSKFSSQPIYNDDQKLQALEYTSGMSTITINYNNLPQLGESPITINVAISGVVEALNSQVAFDKESGLYKKEIELPSTKLKLDNSISSVVINSIPNVIEIQYNPKSLTQPTKILEMKNDKPLMESIFGVDGRLKGQRVYDENGGKVYTEYSSEGKVIKRTSYDQGGLALEQPVFDGQVNRTEEQQLDLSILRKEQLALDEAQQVERSREIQQKHQTFLTDLEASEKQLNDAYEAASQWKEKDPFFERFEVTSLSSRSEKATQLIQIKETFKSLAESLFSASGLSESSQKLAKSDVADLIQEGTDKIAEAQNSDQGLTYTRFLEIKNWIIEKITNLIQYLFALEKSNNEVNAVNDIHQLQ